MPFRFALLKPMRAPGTEEHNSRLLGAMTLGVEVTESELAARCGLGNIDPQHVGAANTASAIKAALTWPLPPNCATLVTIRPDADAYGAMAVLELRAEGQKIDASVRARTGLVCAADRFARGPWPGMRPLPSRVEDIDEVGLGPEGLGVLHAGIACRDTLIELRVRHMRHWLLTGEAPEEWVVTAAAVARVLFDTLTRAPSWYGRRFLVGLLSSKASRPDRSVSAIDARRSS